MLVSLRSYGKPLNPYTARKVSKYGVFSGPHCPLFGLSTGKYGPEKTPYTFHAVLGLPSKITLISQMFLKDVGKKFFLC